MKPIVRVILISIFLISGIFLLTVPAITDRGSTGIALDGRPSDIAINPDTAMAVITAEKKGHSHHHSKDGYAIVVDLNTGVVTAEIPVGRKPEAVAIDRDLNMALVANQKDNTLSVIDLENLQTMATLPAGRSPVSIAINPLTHEALVANHKDDTVSVIDLINLEVLSTIAVGRRPVDIAIEPDLNIALVVNGKKDKEEKHRYRDEDEGDEGYYSLTVIDLNSYEVTGRISVGRRPVAIDINPETDTAVVANKKDSTITVIDILTHKGRSIPVCKDPVDVVLNPLDNRALVLCKKMDEDEDHDGREKGTLLLIDISKGTVVRGYEVNKHSEAVAVDPYTNMAAIVETKTESLHLIQLSNPVPEITTITPSTLLRGSNTQEITIEGNRFIKTSQAYLEGTALETTFINNHQLKVRIPEELLTQTGTFQLTVTNPAPEGGVSNSITLQVENPVPQISVLDPLEVVAGVQSLTLKVYGMGFFDDTVLYVDGQPRQFTLITHTKLEIQFTEEDLETGRYIQIKAYNPPPGGGESKPATFTVLNPAPVLTLISPYEIKAGSGDFTLTLTGNNLVKTSVVTFNNQQYPTTYISPTQIEAVIPEEAIKTPGEYPVTVTNPAPGGGQSKALIFRVTPAVQSLPEGTFGKQYEDLIPTDATIQSYDPKRFSIITGLVKDRTGSPLQGVTVSIHNHPEYGTAHTNTTGRFSIPVEGGGTLTVVYKKEGFLTTHRKVHVPWNDIATAESITMIPPDPVSTTVTFDGNPDTVITHKSTTVTDEFGSRSLTMVFTGDNRAFARDANGNETELANITVRATEFDTPESMPAKLPPTSAYTYAAELSVDGVENVRFEKPVTVYVDNFLGFPVGEIVPVGYYDRKKAVWVPSENGVVVKLLDMDGNGVVDALDATGDDRPDDLNGDGTYSDEVKGLEDPTIYKPGKTYWRVKITHFTPWDCNWPYGPPQDAIAPNPEGGPTSDDQPDTDDTDCNGSYVRSRSRIMHEDIPIPGTGMTLHYASNRVEGYKTVITVPASGSRVPASLKRIIVKVDVAGKKFERTLEPLPYQKADFVWDGLDYMGRPVTGTVTAHVSIGFVYQAVYYSSSTAFARAFAQAGRRITGIRARQEVISWEKKDIKVDRSGKGTLTKGWSLSIHHYMNPSDQSTLYKGNGEIVKNNVSRIITTVAGNGQAGYSGDGGSATEARINNPHGIVIDKEGNLYIADTGNHRIRKVDRNGVISTVAGTGVAGYGGDGGLATEAKLRSPHAVAIDEGGNLYIADAGNHRIRKVSSDGIITTVAGNGNGVYSGDGGPATSAGLHLPRDVVVSPEGGIYIADSFNSRVRYVDPTGIISTIAGNGLEGWSGDGGPAINASICWVRGLTLDDYGRLFTDQHCWHRIRRIGLDGIITKIAGNALWGGYYGDGGLAINAGLNQPQGVAVDSAGNVYIADTDNHVIRMVDTEGIIHTIIGSGSSGYSGDGGSPLEAKLSHPHDIVVGPDGSLYIADTSNNRIRKVSMPESIRAVSGGQSLFFAEQDGFGYLIYYTGRHLKTIDLETGETLLTFGYDDYDRLISITDRFGNITTIQRDANGTPLSITSPDGIVTTLTIDTDNHLTKVTYPDGTGYSFAYTSEGLLTDEYDPKGNHFVHAYDQNGRLTDVYDPEGGHWNYTREIDPSGNLLATKTTAEGNTTTYQDRTDSTGAYISTKTDPSGAQTLISRSGDGLTETRQLSCGMSVEIRYDLDPEYRFKYEKERKETTPAGLIRLSTLTKTYEDTDGNNIPDLITYTTTTNGKNWTLINNTLTGQTTNTSPAGRTITLKYDRTSLLTQEIDIPGLNPTQFSYDTRGRLTGITQSDRTLTFAYDHNGNIDYILTGNRKTDYTYDIMGRLKEEIRPDGTVVRYEYDANGNMTAIVTPTSARHSFAYTGNDQRKSYITPISGSYLYTYDKERKLKTVTFPSGKQIINNYTNGQLTSIQTPEATTALTYGCPAKLTGMTRGSESLTFTYDGSLLTSETYSGTLNQTIGYSYNNDFNLSSITYAGKTDNLSYDSDGLLTGAGSFTITRNTQNGLPETVSDSTFNLNRTYNGYGEIDGYGYNIGGTDVYTLSITRDNEGRIVQRVENIGVATITWNYAYDTLGRLVEVKKNGTVVESYTYDANSNRISETNTFKGVTDMAYTYSMEDHLLTAGTDTYQFDLDGFLTQKTTSSGTTNYKYSSRGELLEVTLPDGTVISYDYDPMSRRIAKRVNGTIVEKYLWSGRIRLLAVYDGSDNLIMRFNYTDDRVPYSMEYLGQTYYLIYDQVGSLRAVVDSSGLVVKRIDYDSFGNVISDTNPSFRVPIGFAGGLYDKDTGLVRFGVRDYDSSIGRWTAKDPIDFGGSSVNLYEYVQSNPVNLFDPLGLFGEGSYGLVELAKYGPTSSEVMKERNIKPVAPVLMNTIPFTVGFVVTAYTENPKLGGLAYELTETVLGLLLDQPAGIPKVIVTPIINPPCAE